MRFKKEVKWQLLFMVLLFGFCGGSCDDDQPNVVPPVNTEPSLVLQESLGGTGLDQHPIVQPTADGGFIMAAQTFSNDVDVSFNHSNDADIWLVKLNASLDIVWEKSLGGSVAENIHNLWVLNDGSLLVGATSNSLDGDVSWNNGSIDWWLVRLDAAGEIQWETNLVGPVMNRLAPCCS